MASSCGVFSTLEVVMLDADGDPCETDGSAFASTRNAEEGAVAVTVGVDLVVDAR
jgi:hypothetical protein